MTGMSYMALTLTSNIHNLRNLWYLIKSDILANLYNLYISLYTKRLRFFNRFLYHYCYKDRPLAKCYNTGIITRRDDENV